MLLYLGHSWPDISFATHQCAQYTHSLKQTHEDALKRIGRYLKGTIKNGLILNPSNTFKIDCYPDADLQAYGYETTNMTQIACTGAPVASFA